MECELLDLPVGSIEDAFTAAIESNVGEINWENLSWPDAPELGFHGEFKHAEVTLLLNTRTRDLDEPTDEHTVLVHVRSADFGGRQMREPYALWLAEQVGLTVIGPGQRWVEAGRAARQVLVAAAVPPRTPARSCDEGPEADPVPLDHSPEHTAPV